MFHNYLLWGFCPEEQFIFCSFFVCCCQLKKKKGSPCQTHVPKKKKKKRKLLHFCFYNMQFQTGWISTFGTEQQDASLVPDALWEIHQSGTRAWHDAGTTGQQVWGTLLRLPLMCLRIKLSIITTVNICQFSVLFRRTVCVRANVYLPQRGAECFPNMTG